MSNKCLVFCAVLFVFACTPQDDPTTDDNIVTSEEMDAFEAKKQKQEGTLQDELKQAAKTSKEVNEQKLLRDANTEKMKRELQLQKEAKERAFQEKLKLQELEKKLLEKERVGN
jgi:hypothetical protein